MPEPYYYVWPAANLFISLSAVRCLITASGRGC